MLDITGAKVFFDFFVKVIFKFTFRILFNIGRSVVKILIGKIKGLLVRFKALETISLKLIGLLLAHIPALCYNWSAFSSRNTIEGPDLFFFVFLVVFLAFLSFAFTLVIVVHDFIFGKFYEFCIFIIIFQC